MLKKSKIKKILVISLTNIGDIILTFPVIDILKQELPDAELSVVIGPKGKSLFQGNSHIKRVYIFDKKQSLLKSVKWVLELRRERFDLVVDLRNTWTPFLTSPRYRTSPVLKRRKGEHMRGQHLRRLRSRYLYIKESEERYAFQISEEDQAYIEGIIKDEIGGDTHQYVVTGPGAADRGKRWPSGKFAQVCDRLIEAHHVKVVFIGDARDRKTAQEVIKKMAHHGINLCGRTSLTQLAHLLRRCFFAVINDSAPMHLASYLNVPILGLFGPTDPKKYGPWGKHPYFIKKDCDASLSPEEKMRAITVDDVIEKVEEIIEKVRSKK